MLCENCHQNQATCRITRIEHGVMTLKNLCSQCDEEELAAAMRTAQCEYCGGQPCARGADIFALATGGHRLKFMCLPCSLEHNRYVQEQIQINVSAASQEEQPALLRRLSRRA